MKFKCECGQTMATDDSAVGMTVECPTCKKRQKVPQADAPNVILPPAAETRPPEWHTVGLRAIPPSSEAPSPQPVAAPVLPVQPAQVQQPSPGPMEVKTIPPRLPGSPLQADMVREDEIDEGAGSAEAFAATGDSVNMLVSPGEKKAFRVLMFASIPALVVFLVLVLATKGTFLLLAVLVVLFGWLAGQFAAAYVRANAIRVSERQLPELHKIATTFAAMAGKPVPEVYVMQGSAWNAMAMRLANTRMVVLLSGAVDSLLLKGDMRQVAWLVGHELGHHFAGHLDFRRRIFVNACMIFPWLVFWYQRRCELTCDRYGLACAGSAGVSMQALANMAAGAQLGPQVDVGAAVEQWVLCRDTLFVRLRTLYSSHPHILCRIAETAASARELNMQA